MAGPFFVWKPGPAGPGIPPENQVKGWGRQAPGVEILRQQNTTPSPLDLGWRGLHYRPMGGAIPGPGPCLTASGKAFCGSRGFFSKKPPGRPRRGETLALAP